MSIDLRRYLLQGLALLLAFMLGVSFATRFGVPGAITTVEDSTVFAQSQQRSPQQVIVAAVLEPAPPLALPRPPRSSRLPNTFLYLRDAREGAVLRPTSASLSVASLAACDELPVVNVTAFGSVVIEIGTNISPETSKLNAGSPRLESAGRSTTSSRKRPNASLVQVEDLLATATDDDNAESNPPSSAVPRPAPPNRFSVVPNAADGGASAALDPRFFITVDPLPESTAASVHLRKVHRVYEAAIVPTCGEVSFFVDKALSGVYANAASKAAPKIVVGAFPLEALLRSLHPPERRVQVLLVDAQGFDQSVVMSGGRMLDRVDNIVLECQHLPIGDPRLLSPLAGNCANASIALQAIGFRFGFCMWNMGPQEMNCWFYHPRFFSPEGAIGDAVPLASRRNNSLPSALLPVVGDLFRAMCPSFVIGHLFAVACKLPSIVWYDPADLGTPAPLADRCPALEQMYMHTPESKRRGRQNHAMLLSCATGKSFDEALAEVKSTSSGTAVGYRKKRIVVRRKERA